VHKECIEKGSTSSTPACCNRRLAEGEKPHPANYRDCRKAKEELQTRRHRERPYLSLGRCSQTTSPQVCLSWRHSEAAQSSSSDVRHAMFRWLVHPEQKNKLYRPLNCSKKQFNQFTLHL
jgi:hypothetical protein